VPEGEEEEELLRLAEATAAGVMGRTLRSKEMAPCGVEATMRE